MRYLIILIIFLTSSYSAFSQEFNLQDTLRGSITPERAWWDLDHYDLSVKVDPEEKYLSGKNVITYTVIEEGNIMQIDLQEPMNISKVIQNGTELTFIRNQNVFLIQIQEGQIVNEKYSLTIYYDGQPTVAERPPWDGGLTWTNDDMNNHFIATSCQGEGASMWWPCKDHMYDEPDSMLITITVPSDLIDVSNGKLRSIKEGTDGYTSYQWAVVNPINNYGVNINVANYAHFEETYQGENGDLTCDYWILEYNVAKAKEQFKQVPMMLEAFEHWFGPYPFYEDGYKLVEVPYLGMEHQSSVTYGNEYNNGYLGRDLSGTGWGKKFDFIIIHESGHEWFANNITYKDMADMWIHESFTAYSEGLYLDYHFGKEAATEYVIGTRRGISNDTPIIGFYDVNHSGSGDMYYKGANMLHMIRTIIDDDKKWRTILRGLNETFYHKTVTTKQIEDYMIEHSGLDLQPIFDQYLRTTEIPQLEYYTEKGKLFYRWVNCVPHFNMSVQIHSKDSILSISPTIEWQEIKIDRSNKRWKMDSNYYVTIEKSNK